MKKLKEFFAKRSGIFNTAFAFAIVVATADLAQNVALRVGGVPCYFLLGQPKLPNSLLKNIEER